MTPQEINIAIAESLGWKYLKNIITPSRSFNGAQSMGDCWQRPDGDRGYGDYEPPNYCNDLNAMHEVEKSITDPRKMLDYFNHLARYNDPDARSIQDSFNIITATALQRAEAYLRTIGKWND